MTETFWRRCSNCKREIAFSTRYWTCSVSTCNRKRTGLVFCSLSCWEIHLPVANHRKAWAERRIAPRTRDAAEASPAPRTSPAPTALPSSARAQTDAREPRRIVVSSPPAAPSTHDASAPREVLIVASRLKDYVRARAGFNTSDRVLEPLSVIVRRAVDAAIESARRDGRRTILDRDVPKS